MRSYLLHPNIKSWEIPFSREEQKKGSSKYGVIRWHGGTTRLNIGRWKSIILKRNRKNMNQYANRLMSDNGARARKNFYSTRLRPIPSREITRMKYAWIWWKVNSYMLMGRNGQRQEVFSLSNITSFTTEGGMNVPLIHCRAGVAIKKASMIHFYFNWILHLLFMKRAATSYPDKWNGKDVKPLLGASLVPVLTWKETSSSMEIIPLGWSMPANAMLRKGDWKITQIDRPFALRKFLNYTDLSKILGRAKWSSEKIP